MAEYLNSINGTAITEVHLTIVFTVANSVGLDASVKIEYGNHEELYELLRTGGVDLVPNEQRRAFSDEYVNLILTVGNEYIEFCILLYVEKLLLITEADFLFDGKIIANIKK